MYDAPDYDGDQRYMVEYGFANHPKLNLIIWDLRDRQEPGEHFDPSGRGCPIMYVGNGGEKQREFFINWLDQFLKP